MNLWSTKFHLHCGCVVSNPQRDSILNGTAWGGVEFGISAGNFGCSVAINGTEKIINVTWKEVFCGSKYDMQIWKEGDDFW